VVYCTQGNGELDLSDSEVAERLGDGRIRPNMDNGLGVLKDRLQQRHIEVKPLQIKSTDPKVPADAALVIIAAPRTTVPDFFIKAMDEYMARKGKLLVLVEPLISREGKFRPTGLEDFLARYNVQLPPELVLTRSRELRNPLTVPARLNPALRDNPLVKAFGSQTIMLQQARPVRSAPAGPPGMTPFRTEPLLLADPRASPWAEPKVSALNEIIRLMDENPSFRNQKLEPGQRDPIPMAVVVSESSNPHAGMGMRMPPTGPETPRLVVIGDATLATNIFVSEGSGTVNFDFLASSIDWLRGKTSSIGIAPKKPGLYVMKNTLTYWPFVLLPSLVICVGVIGAGTGVWLVRRR
jgi:hypothetical protein